MKVLFSTLHFANLRNFESVVRALAGRGHEVHLLADEQEGFGGQALVERLAADCPGVTWGWAPSPAGEPWFPVAQKLRYALDYVRFLDPRYADVPKLRLRNIARTPRLIRWLAPLGHVPVTALLTWLERSMPRSVAMERFVAAHAPDVVVLTSLTFSRSFQIEQLKAARGLGIPVAAAILSWDHLSSKALLHIAPDMTIVWNDVQKREAVEMHGLPADRVVVTGAQCYDQWFDRQPARTRDAFCRDVGLDPARPIVLYVCSTMSPPPNPLEPHFVREWITALRSSGDPLLRDAGVLVRPHPERVKEWEDVALDGFDNVVLHGRMPLDGDAKADYFDALYHSDAVVGLCTSAFLEAAIAGCPVLTLLLPEYRIHQEGMAHFRYLLNVEGGLLHTAPDMAAHVGQLSAVLQHRGRREERNLRFLTAFVRPGGLDVPATPAFVDAVERLAREGPRAPDPRFAAPSPAGAFVGRLAAAGRAGVGRRLLMDDVDDQRVESERLRSAQKRSVLDERAARWEAERRARTDRIRANEEKQRRDVAKRRVGQWRRWRYAISTSGPVARLKGGLRHLTGARHP